MSARCTFLGMLINGCHPLFGDPETDAGPWQFLDPGSREVEDICLLADGLFALLVEIGKLDDKMDVFALAVHDQDAA